MLLYDFNATFVDRYLNITTMKNFLSLLLLFSLSLHSMATSYERQLARMNDHFDHAEWSEVLQETKSMVVLQPGDVEPYSAALIAAQFLNDIPTENKYLSLSQSNRIHIDSLLHHVYVRSKLIHNAQVYESLLLNLKANNKWLARVFNIYLLDFYNFARQTHETIKIADELLHATPNNIRFKKIKANALFYQGDSHEAVLLYENILHQDSTDYETLTFLGAYYTADITTDLDAIDSLYINDNQAIDSIYIARKQEIIDNRLAHTIELLQQAHNMRPSQHLASEIQRLSKIDCQLPMRDEKRKAKRHKPAK